MHAEIVNTPIVLFLTNTLELPSSSPQVAEVGQVRVGGGLVGLLGGILGLGTGKEGYGLSCVRLEELTKHEAGGGEGAGIVVRNAGAWMRGTGLGMCVPP